ncbi:ABC transporter ATP-binding protein [Pseudoflavitalea rhizosphaerae]|uniref:ABC transporter ATP-binding protein n=1 Tax=Pseudoflavitalea rhizosphaerae TaxID=1884793 RepID=UPI000F8DBF32|nr:ABC transporter ATP-binding protein [Pseudoflavitalea rhizosphaerae]
MPQPIISIENLSKQFIIAHEAPQRYRTLRDTIADNAKKLLNGNKKDGRTSESFYALRDLSFDLYPGDRLGIIGRNGAGKSTLLKVLSRITEPTSGRITIRGRVASLLEVGTGFHPELTGRENIFLNGAILGMSRAEIRKKFDEIVAFAEIDRFLDTPVKRYSSGMYVRLAFSVAAHLEPEILIVDEVLAVGDSQFQKKCLGKMEDVSKGEGRTILFVSHNMNTVSSLCNKCVLLEKGTVKKTGDPFDTINYYLANNYGKKSIRIWEDGKPGNDIVRLHSLRIIDKEGVSKESYYVNETLGIEMQYEVFEDGHVLWSGHNIFNAEGLNIFDTHSVTSEYYNKPHQKGKYSAIVWIPQNLLAEGTYVVGSAIFNHLKRTIHFHEKDAVVFNIMEAYDGVTAKGSSPGHFPGLVRPLLDWNIIKQ